MNTLSIRATGATLNKLRRKSGPGFHAHAGPNPLALLQNIPSASTVEATTRDITMPGTAAPNVALKPWLAPKKENMGPDQAAGQLDQLIIERGQHLRYISEQGLQEEIETGKQIDGKDGEEEVMEGIEGGEKKEEGPTKESRIQDIYVARQQIYHDVEYVQPRHLMGKLLT